MIDTDNKKNQDISLHIPEPSFRLNALNAVLQISSKATVSLSATIATSYSPQKLFVLLSGERKSNDKNKNT